MKHNKIPLFDARQITANAVFEHFGYDSSFLQHSLKIDPNPQLFNSDTIISLLQFKHRNFSVTEHYTNARKCQF